MFLNQIYILYLKHKFSFKLLSQKVFTGQIFYECVCIQKVCFAYFDWLLKNVYTYFHIF